MTSIQGKSCLAQRDWAFKASTGFLFYQSDRLDYENPLGSNKPRSPKALTFKALVPSLKVPELDITQYI